MTKKLLLCFTFLIFTLGTKAQYDILSLSVKGGINTATTNLQNSNARVGYNLGLTLVTFLPSNFAMFNGIEFVSKNLNIKYQGGPTSPELKSNAMYIEIPLKMGYKIQSIEKSIGFHVAAGGYFGLGVGGKTTMRIDNKETRFSTFGYDDYQLKDMDWGLSAEIGLQFKLLEVSIGYDFGLVNISNSEEKIKNRNFYATLGYVLFR